MSEAGTQEDRQSTPLVERVQMARPRGREDRAAGRPSHDGEGKRVPEAADFRLPRKAASEAVGARTANRHR